MVSLGPWRLGVELSPGSLGRRFLAADGTHVAELEHVERDDAWLDEVDQALASLVTARPPWGRTWPSVREGERAGLLREHLPGVSLRALTRALFLAQQPPSAAVACAVVAPVARAFQAGAPDLQADLTPDDVRIGPGGRLQLALDPRLPVRNEFLHMGRPRFAFFPPELVRGQFVSAAGGAWRTGALLAFALTARAPHDGTSDLDTLTRLTEGKLVDPSWLERLAPRLREVVAAALAPQPEARPGLGELAAALEAHADAEGLSAELAARFGSELAGQRDQLEQVQGRDPDGLPGALAERALARDEREVWSMIADWLLAQGRPRGELAALQLKGDATSSTAASRLLERYAQLTPRIRGPRRLVWHAGWVRELELELVADAWQEAVYLSHPSLRFLRRIRVLGDEAACLRLIDALATVRPIGLRRFELAYQHRVARQRLAFLPGLELVDARR